MNPTTAKLLLATLVCGCSPSPETVVDASVDAGADAISDVRLSDVNDTAPDLAEEADAAGDIGSCMDLRVAGEIDNLRTCNDICSEQSLECVHNPPMSFGGSASYSETLSGLLTCEDIPSETATDLDGEEYSLRSYSCTCVCPD